MLERPWSILGHDISELEGEAAHRVFAVALVVLVSDAVHVFSIDERDADFAGSNLLEEVVAADVLGPGDEAVVQVGSRVNWRVLDAELGAEHHCGISLVDVFRCFSLNSHYTVIILELNLRPSTRHSRCSQRADPRQDRIGSCRWC